MAHLFEDLEAKFGNLDTKIEEKKVFVENLGTDQQDLLKEHFNENILSKKYSTEFNNARQSLLQSINPANQRLKMDHINELVHQNASVQVYLDELKKVRRIKFIRGLIKSEMACIWRVVLKEFRFRCQFNASQIIKYKHILGIRDDLFQERCPALIDTRQTSKLDITRSLMFAYNNNHFEIIEYLF